MIITRTPFRISFTGGGSDIPLYYREHSAAVVSVSINKYVYLSMHPFFHSDKIFLKYSQSELVNSTADINHKIIKKVFSDYKILGVDFNSSADIPAGTGLGSSSAFTVGLINLCNAYTNKYMSKEEIAEYASHIEINHLKEPIGKQDQYASALGGLNYITFHPDDTVSTDKIIIEKDKYRELQNSLLLFYLGDIRSASAILTEQKKNMESDKKRIENLKKMVQLSTELKEELLKSNIDSIGEILHKGWMYKKELASQISNEKIDHYYNLALENGAQGGKLLGAGGGGFLLFYVSTNKKDRLRKSLKDLYELDFHFDNVGTSLIYYD